MREGGGECYGWWGFRGASRNLLGNMVCSSFKWLSFKYSA